jgi:uncharacterized repeat protein (TIGR01451 family)
MFERKFSVLLAGALSLSVAAGVLALTPTKTILGLLPASRPDVRLELHGAVRRGDQLLSVDKANPIGHGEFIVWTIEASNVGDGPANGLVVGGQVASGTQFVGGSASAPGARILYSINQGRDFSPQPLIEKKDDKGQIVMVPAPSSLYTNVRFEWSGKLEAEARLSGTYQVEVTEGGLK